jgi:hypothetical protein
MEQPGSQNETHPPTYLPTSIKGIGTRFFGQRDFRPDGTYVTTEFSILFHIPVLPIRSVRVRYDGVRRNTETGIRGPQYEIREETSLNWIQILYVYAYVVFVFWWLFFWLTHCDKLTKNLDEKVGALTIVVGFIWQFFIPQAMRFIRRKFLKLSRVGNGVP